MSAQRQRNQRTLTALAVCLGVPIVALLVVHYAA